MSQEESFVMDAQFDLVLCSRWLDVGLDGVTFSAVVINLPSRVEVRKGSDSVLKIDFLQLAQMVV